MIACPNANSGYSEGLTYAATFSAGIDATLYGPITASLSIEMSVSTSEGFHAEVRGGDAGDPNACCKRLWTMKNVQWNMGTLCKDHYRHYLVNGIPIGPPELTRTDSTPNVEVKSGGLDGDGWLRYTSGSTPCWDESAECGDQTDFCQDQC